MAPNASEVVTRDPWPPEEAGSEGEDRGWETPRVLPLWTQLVRQFHSSMHRRDVVGRREGVCLKGYCGCCVVVVWLRCVENGLDDEPVCVSSFWRKVIRLTFDLQTNFISKREMGGGGTNAFDGHLFTLPLSTPPPPPSLISSVFAFEEKIRFPSEEKVD